MVRRAVIQNYLLLAASLIFVLGAAELLLRIALPQNFAPSPPGMYTQDASVGYVLTPGFSGTFVRGEFEHEVQFNSAGLRGPGIRSRESRSFRIVCLGDSFTWGWGAHDAETFPRLLERKLAARYPELDIQVLNAGVPGYGTADELRFLESRRALLDPDLLVVQFLADNDFIENRSPALGRVEVENGMLHAREPPRRQPWRTMDWIKEHSHLARFVSERIGYLLIRSGLIAPEAGGGKIDADDARLTTDLFRRLTAVAESAGAASIFMFATGQAPVISENTMSIPAAAVVARAAGEANADFIDLAPLLRAQPNRDQFYYSLDAHWTAAAHKAVADILEAHIVERYDALIRRKTQRPREKVAQSNSNRVS